MGEVEVCTFVFLYRGQILKKGEQFFFFFFLLQTKILTINIALTTQPRFNET